MSSEWHHDYDYSFRNRLCSLTTRVSDLVAPGGHMTPVLAFPRGPILPAHRSYRAPGEFRYTKPKKRRVVPSAPWKVFQETSSVAFTFPACSAPTSPDAQAVRRVSEHEQPVPRVASPPSDAQSPRMPPPNRAPGDTTRTVIGPRTVPHHDELSTFLQPPAPKARKPEQVGPFPPGKCHPNDVVWMNCLPLHPK